MPYTIQIAPAASRELRKLTDDDWNRIKPEIDGLAHEPRPNGCRKLKEFRDLYRIRVGDFRIIYKVTDKELIVLIAWVGNRDAVYQELKRLNL